VKRDLDATLWLQLDEWKRGAQERHDEYPTSLVFNGEVLHMASKILVKESAIVDTCWTISAIATASSCTYTCFETS